jgi:pantoate--beta-alanine ligase
VQVLTTIAEVREARAAISGAVGLIPTMGALHDGHLALARAARSANQCVFVSIFVNPTQFGPDEDFAAYPRDTERDLALLRAEAVDFVFMPPAGEMYPTGSRSRAPTGRGTSSASRPSSSSCSTSSSQPAPTSDARTRSSWP